MTMGLTLSHFLIHYYHATAPTKIYTLSLHDALPICEYVSVSSQADTEEADMARERRELATQPEAELAELAAIYEQRGVDRKSTRLNSSHITTSYAVFCLKKKSLRDTLGSDRFRSWLC